jgi:ATP-dependent Clp protease ATP-binding subunit ClpC
MFAGFTERARTVMTLANREAERLNHEYVGSEHILVGLVDEGSGLAAIALQRFGVDLTKVQSHLEKLVRAGLNSVPSGERPLTPRAKKVIAYAFEEARNLGHNFIGTEHLLLALLREWDGVAAQVLTNMGSKLEAIRGEVLNILRDGNTNETNKL